MKDHAIALAVTFVAFVIWAVVCPSLAYLSAECGALAKHAKDGEYAALLWASYTSGIVCFMATCAIMGMPLVYIETRIALEERR